MFQFIRALHCKHKYSTVHSYCDMKLELYRFARRTLRPPQWGPQPLESRRSHNELHWQSLNLIAIRLEKPEPQSRTQFIHLKSVMSYSPEKRDLVHEILSHTLARTLKMLSRQQRTVNKSAALTFVDSRLNQF